MPDEITRFEGDVLDAGAQQLLSVWGYANEKQWLTLTGLDPYIFTEGYVLTPDDEEKLVLFIGGMGDAAAWARGDFALYVRTKIRARADAENWPQARYNEVWGTELDRLARQFAVAPKTLLNNVSTCANWPQENRVAGEHVRYKHHEAIPTTLPMLERIDLLRSCEENEWTWARLYNVARGRIEADGTVPENAAPPVAHIDMQDVDGHIERMNGHLEPDEANDVFIEGEAYNVTLATEHDDLPFDYDDDDVPEHNNIAATQIENGALRIAGATDSLSTVPSDVSVTLRDENDVTSIVVQDGDADVTLQITFGGTVAWTVRTDRLTQTLIVERFVD